jgi:hypothetical protein
MLSVLRLLCEASAAKDKTQGKYTMSSSSDYSIPPNKLALLCDTEGKSPLELSIGIVRDGKLIKIGHFLQCSQVAFEVERWGIEHIHGVDPSVGLSAANFAKQVKEFLQTNLGLEAGEKVNLYFPGALGAGDKKVLDLFGDWINQPPHEIKLAPWSERMEKHYHQLKDHPNVEPCPYGTHALYRQKPVAPTNPSKRARWEHGFHCATADVLELFYFMDMEGYFK